MCTVQVPAKEKRELRNSSLARCDANRLLEDLIFISRCLADCGCRMAVACKNDVDKEEANGPSNTYKEEARDCGSNSINEDEEDDVTDYNALAGEVMNECFHLLDNAVSFKAEVWYNAILNYPQLNVRTCARDCLSRSDDSESHPCSRSAIPSPSIHYSV